MSHDLEMRDQFLSFYVNYDIKGSYLLLMLSVLLITSCDRSSTSERTYTPTFPYYIDMEKYYDNWKSLPLSTLGKEIEYVTLETSPDCMIESISGLWLNDSLIVIRSNSPQVFIFDRSGKLIRKIGSYGRGPGEYNILMGMNVDQPNNIILVSEMRRTLSFDFNGKFLGSFDHPFVSGPSLMLDENRIMFYESISPMNIGGQHYNWHILDLNGNELFSIENNLPVYSLIRFESLLYMYEGYAHFMKYGMDTLFYYDDNEVMPYAIFNAGKYERDYEMQFSSIDELREKLRDKIDICTARENNDFIFLDIEIGFENFNKAIYSKSTGEFAILSDTTFYNDIDGGINFWPEFIIDDNIMIDYVDAFELILHLDSVGKASKNVNKEKYMELTELKERINEFSNPVIMIVK